MEEQIIQYQRIVDIAMNKLRITVNREEFQQEGLIALWEGLLSYDPEKGPLEPYLYMYVRFRLMNEFNRRYKLMEKEIQNEELFYFLEDPSSKSAEDHLLVRDLLAQLNEEERTIIIASYFKGLNGKELAKLLSISEEAAKKRKQRTLRKLRKLAKNFP